MRRIRAEHPTHPYAAAGWSLGQGIGYGASFVNHVGDLLERWPRGPWRPDFAQGVAVQAVCQAMEDSAQAGRWVSINDVVGGT